jgi:hypothetical protein
MKYVILLFLLLVSFSGFSQAKTRRLPNTINHPAINNYAPYMSLDGDAIVYLSDNAEDFAVVPFFSYRDGTSDWREPVPLSKNLFTRLSFLNGYTLGPSGAIMFFSTLKGPTVGGFDLWISERKGSTWGEPKNLSAPINSKEQEGCATITPDGKQLYFMRCSKMDQQSASGCRIMVSTKKSNGQWDEPVELPPAINTGNSQAPRILADAETLIFSSDQFPGNKGGLDLYISRLKDGNWSVPVPLDFVNTPKNDQFVSVNGVGRYLIRDSPGTKKSELVEYLIPPNLRPKGLTRIEGKVNDPNGKTVASYISVVDVTNSKRIFNGRPGAAGTFTLFLLEGSKYDLSIDPEQSNLSFYSKKFDFSQDEIPQIQKVSAIIKPIENQDEFDLNVDFKPLTSEITSSSEDELKRLARVVKSNSNFKFEIQVLQVGYVQDSLQSDPDLTEVLRDTIKVTAEGIDSLGQNYQYDSLVVKTVYHNDRTTKQADSIINFLLKQGIDTGRLSHFANSRPEAVEEKKNTLVRVKVLKN